MDVRFTRPVFLGLLLLSILGCEQPVVGNETIQSSKPEIINIPSNSIPKAVIGAGSGGEMGTIAGSFAILHQDYKYFDLNFGKIEANVVDVLTHQTAHSKNGGNLGSLEYHPDGSGGFFVFSDNAQNASSVTIRKLNSDGQLDPNINYRLDSTDPDFSSVWTRISDRSVQCSGQDCDDFIYVTGSFNRLYRFDANNNFIPGQDEGSVPFPMIKINKFTGEVIFINEPNIQACDADGVTNCSAISGWQNGQMPAGFSSSIRSNLSFNVIKFDSDDLRMDYWAFKVPSGKRLKINDHIFPDRPFVFYDPFLDQIIDIHFQFEFNTPIFLYNEEVPYDDDGDSIPDGTNTVPVYADSWAPLSRSSVDTQFTVGKPNTSAYMKNNPAFLIRNQVTIDPGRTRFSMYVDGNVVVSNFGMTNVSGPLGHDQCFNSPVAPRSCFAIDPIMKRILTNASIEFTFKESDFRTGAFSSVELWPASYRPVPAIGKLVKFQKVLSADSKIYELSFQTCAAPNPIVSPSSAILTYNCPNLSALVTTGLFDLNDGTVDLDNTGFKIVGEHLWLWGLKGSFDNYFMVLQKFNLNDNSLIFEKPFSIPKINILEGVISNDRIHFDIQREIPQNAVVEFDMENGTDREISFDLGGGYIEKTHALGNEFLIEGFFTTVNGISSPGFFIYNPETQQIRRNSLVLQNSTFYSGDSVEGCYYYQPVPADFNISSTLRPTIYVLDDKIYLTGGFDSINGIPTSGAVRLNSDLTIDTPFNLLPSVFNPVPLIFGAACDPATGYYGLGAPRINRLDKAGSNSEFLYSDSTTLLFSNGAASGFTGLIDKNTGQRFPITSTFFSNYNSLVDQRFLVSAGPSSFSFYDILTNQVLPFSLSGYSFSPTNTLALSFDMTHYKNFIIVAATTRVGSDTKKLVAIEIKTDSVSVSRDLSSFVPTSQNLKTDYCTVSAYDIPLCRRLWIRKINETHLAIATDDDQVIYSFQELGLDD